MKETAEAQFTSDDTVVLIAGKGNYAMFGAKGTAMRIRTAPQGAMLDAESAAALMAPLG